MTRSQKLAVRLVTFLPVVLILAASALYIVGQVNRVLENARVVVSAELSHRFDREVKLGDVRLSPLGAAVFDKVEIAEGRKLAHGKLLSARQVIVHYNWRALLSGKGIQSIREIELVDPRLSLIRREDGTINIVELFKPPPGPPGPPFTAKVTVRGGRVCFKDMLAGTQRVPAVNCLDYVDAVLDAGDQPAYKFRLTARGEAPRAGEVKAVGVYNARTKEMDLDVHAEDLSAHYWADYLGASKTVEVLNGKLTLATGLRVTHIGTHTQMSLTGYARVADGSVLLPHTTQPIDHINGTVAFAGEQAALELEAALAGSTATLTGVVADFGNPKLDLLVRAPRLDYATLLKAIELPKTAARVRFAGTGSAIAVVRGSLADPLVEVTASVPSASIQGYKARNIRLSGAYCSDRAVLQSLTFSAMGARVRAEGTVALGAVPAISIRGRVDHLPLAALPIPTDVPILGTADASFAVAGAIFDPRITVSATMPGGAVAGIPFGPSAGRFEIMAGKARVADLLVRDVAGGVLRASGDLALNALKMDVAVEGANVGSLAAFLGRPDYQGIGYFRGRVTGPVRDPTVSGVAEVFGGRYRDYESEYVRAAFIGDSRHVRIEKAVIRMPPAEIDFSGDLTRPADDRFAFRGRGIIERFSAQHLMAMLGREADLTGVIAGDFEGSGIYLAKAKPDQSPWVDTQATGMLRMENGEAYGIPVTTAVLHADLQDDVLTLTESAITSEDAQLALTGSIFLEGSVLDLKFDLANLELARFPGSFGDYLLVSGMAAAHGTITGTWHDQLVSGTADVDALTVNNNIFDTARLDFEYAHSLVAAASGKLRQGNQLYEIDITDYDPTTRCVASGTAHLIDVSVPDLWDMIRGSPYVDSEEAERFRNALNSIPRLSSGLLNGTVQFSGCVFTPDGKPVLPDGTLTVEARDVGMDIQRIESIDVELASVGGEVKLNHFLAVSGDLNIQAKGDPLYKDGVIQLELAAQNLDLSRLRPWLGENTPGGMMSAEFEAEGAAEEPKVFGSVEVVAPQFRGIEFDRFRASTIEIESGRIQLSDIILAAGVHQAVAHGYLPWDWSEKSILGDKPIELVAELDDQDLSMLSVFLPAIAPGQTTGLVKGQLRLTGTILEPQIDGELKVADGTIAVANFTNSFTDVQLDLAFDGNRAVFNEMSALSSEGGAIAVEPGSEILLDHPDGPQANILLSAQGLRIGEHNLLGYQENVKLQLDAGVSITGDLLRPLIADAAIGTIPGGVTVSNARIAFALPEEAPERQPVAFPIDPTFDVTLRLGDDVWIVPPSMSLLVTAPHGTIAGSLSEPNIVLDLEIQEGNINLAGRRLRVVPGGTIRVAYAPVGPEVLVDLQATTSVTATSQLGRRERYEITIDVSGPIANLNIDLSSRPAGLTREQMLAALGHVEGLFASAESGLQRDLASVLSAVGTSTFFAPIETVFVERLGFEQFTVEYGGETPLSVYVSRRFFGSFYVSYFQVIGPGTASLAGINYQFMFSYRFKRQYEVSSSVDDQQTLTFEVRFTRPFN